MSSSEQPRSFVERIGAALVAPRAALAVADAPGSAGRTGNDAAVLLALYVCAVYTADLAVAGWMIGADSAMAGLGAFASMVGRAIGLDLVVIVGASLVTTLAAGRRRAMGRDVDLACVAYVPFVVVRLAGELVAFLAGVHATPAAATAILAPALVWAGVVVVLAVGVARGRAVEAPA